MSTIAQNIELITFWKKIPTLFFQLENLCPCLKTEEEATPWQGGFALSSGSLELGNILSRFHRQVSSSLELGNYRFYLISFSGFLELGYVLLKFIFRYPRVRKGMADAFYTALVTFDDVIDNTDDVSGILENTVWDDPIVRNFIFIHILVGERLQRHNKGFCNVWMYYIIKL